MKAALLAAGRGNRLRPATDHIPKPLLPIACSTLLEHNLLQLSGFNEVYVVISYKKELFSRYGEVYGVKLIDQGEPLGTGHATLKLAELMGEEFLLVYSDVYLPPAFLDSLMREFDKYDHVAAVAPVDRPWEFGVVELEGRKLKRIVEKPRRGEEPSNLVIAGAFILSPSIFDILRELAPSPRGEVELTSAITEAVSRGEEVGVVEVSPWVDAGRREDFLKAQEFLLRDMITGCRKLPEGFKAEGSILIGRNAEIFESEIEGPCCLDAEIRGSLVGFNTYLQSGSEVISSVVRNSVVMGGSSIRDSEVISSIVSARSKVLNSKLVDSILPEGVEVKDLVT